MSDDQSPAVTAGDEPVVETVETEAPTEGQVKDQTAEAPEGAEDEAAKSEPQKETSKERRERDKAYKQRLRDEAAAAQAKVEEAEARHAKIVEAGQSSKEPVEADFADYTEYVAAKAVWKHATQAAERDATEASTEADQARQRAQAIKAQEQQATIQQWEAQVAEARTRYADYDAVTRNPDLRFSQTMAEVVTNSDAGPDLAYHIASRPELSAAIAQMSPLEAAREMGRIEAGLTAPKPRIETNAPPPIAPVKSKASASRDPSKMSNEEYRKWRGLK